MFYEEKNALNALVKPQGCTQCVLVTDTPGASFKLLLVNTSSKCFTIKA